MILIGWRAGLAWAALAIVSATMPAHAGPNPYSQSFTAFESGQVRPLAMTPDRRTLLAVNTPAARLEVFRIGAGGLEHRASVPVGLEPVAVAARTNGEAWVVNHLSDSVSVVSLDDTRSTVKATLWVGDEPRDIVFAGRNRERAFIATAHRGQNSPLDPQLTTPGVGRADVWVFDAAQCCRGTAAGGRPLTVLSFFSDTPRALAATPDGSKVYVAAFHSGNATASTFGGSHFGIGNPLPPVQMFPGVPFPIDVNAFGQPQDLTGVIARFDGVNWRDENGLIRDAELPFTLPDRDVFAIDANASPPRPINGAGGVYAGVGTTLFNMAVNPVSGRIYVSNLEANNLQRFEAANHFAGALTRPKPSVRGKIAQSRITVLEAQGGVRPRHLNKHIDYGVCCATNGVENATSVAFPMGMEVSADGSTLYVAALGTSEVAIYDTAQLEDDRFVPDVAAQVAVSGGGPTGLVLDEPAHRLYVLTRFDNAVKTIDLRTRKEVGRASMYNPEPRHVVDGRRFLYDASFSSSKGDSACASCHMFADTDHLAWNLGDPDAQNLQDPNVKQNASPRYGFASMKGLMATQSLRGLDNMGPMHWRGDRTGGYAQPSAQPNSGAFDEAAAFDAFNGAFVSLLGRTTTLLASEMQAFGRFILEVMYPPNPIRNLDNSLTPLQKEGLELYMGRRTFFDPTGGATLNCNACHTIDRMANAGQTTKPGFFGSNSLTTEVAGPVPLKNPHLRNMYQKVGKFGFPRTPVYLNGPAFGVHQGEQIRGYGFGHDGSFDTMFNFNFAPNFGTGDVQPEFPSIFGIPIVNPEGIRMDAQGDRERAALEAFMLVMDTNFAPAVGQQVTVTRDNRVEAMRRLQLLKSRATADECDLVAIRSGSHEGLLLERGLFRNGNAGTAPLGERQLLDASPDGVTFTCVPRGNGTRLISSNPRK
jgi:DNA-binding beta-propeller fold protein YncE